MQPINCAFIFSNTLKKRLIYTTALLSSKSRQKNAGSQKILQNNYGSLQFFDALFASSLKPFLDINKIHLLDEFLEPVHDLTNTYNFVADENVAKDIVEKTSSKNEKNQDIIVEGNPGLGLITINLINSGVPHVYVFESSNIQVLSLVNLIQKYPNQITKKGINMNKTPDSVILKVFDLGRQHNLGVKFIGVTTSFYFLRLLVVVFLKDGLWKHKYTIYLVISTRVLHSLKTFSPKLFRFPQFCAFNLLFKTEILATYPRDAFLPLSKNNIKEMVLIKISSNPDCFKYFREEELIEYVIFISILGTSSHNFIIPTLEKWFPDCGPYLISKGISMTQQVRDLTPEDSITLFKIFKKCEGYDDYKFCSSQIFKTTLNVS